LPESIPLEGALAEIAAGVPEQSEQEPSTEDNEIQRYVLTTVETRLRGSRS
jgi:hypothetical protein